MNKDEIRKKYIDIRKNIPNKADQSINITNELIRRKEFINAETIAVYSSLPDEVNTTMISNMSILLGKHLCFPKVIDKDTLEFYYVNDTEELAPGKHKILEPTTNDLVNIKDIDLMLVPGICFDKQNNRIGYGKGYYDKYLSRNHHFKTIALAFKEQMIDEIPTTLRDIPMDEVITDPN